VRKITTSGPLSVRAIAGTYVVLMAFDLDASARPGLRGFAIKRGVNGAAPDWLEGIKFFEALVPHFKTGDMFSSRKHPFQTFLWSDYTAHPATPYTFTVVALYGDIHALEERHTTQFTISTEPEDDGSHGVWFNRGAIASHALATQFNNKKLTDAMTENVSDAGVLLDKETAWLSRGLAEACLAFINGTVPGEGLRVCAYEFTYIPVLKALKRAINRGVDVRIIYHATKENQDAVDEVGLPVANLALRTRPPIPHNKFIVKLVAGKPKRVWTGSTNFTDTGFFGQTNVGHLVTDDKTASTYLNHWEVLKDNPVRKGALASSTALTPNPANVLNPLSITPFFSPRVADNMLDWYGQRITNVASLAMMTIPFNVADPILKALATKSSAMRMVILEDIPTAEVNAAEKLNRGKLAFSNGAIFGKSFIKIKSSFGGAKVAPIPNSDLDKWFVEEELPRPTNHGHVYFVHSKVLLIDPLSDDPLVCSGSANFSKASLTTNDENMLLIRGSKRVADIYMTELDRIFRHFRARDVLNETSTHAPHVNPLALDTTDAWIAPHFTGTGFKNNRRQLFFPPAGTVTTWFARAALDPNPFLDEAARAKAPKAKTKSKTKTKKKKKKKTVTKAKAKTKTMPKKKAKAKKKAKVKKKARKKR